MKPVVIIKCGNTDEELLTLQGDFENWIVERSALKSGEYMVIDARKQTMLPLVSDISGVIITGSHDNITDQKPWMIELCMWLQQFTMLATPVLGICFGHQLLGHAFGGKVGYHPKGNENGIVQVNIEKNKVPAGFFTSLPEIIYCYAAHEQTILELPKGAISFGYNNHDSNHLVHFAANIWGCQFHPEFNQTASNYYLKQSDANAKNLFNNFSDADKTGGQILSDFRLHCFKLSNG